MPRETRKNPSMVFICHHSSPQSDGFANTLNHLLKQRNIRGWVDHIDNGPDRMGNPDFQKTVVKALDRAKALVFVANSGGFRSDHCFFELQTAHARGVPIFYYFPKNYPSRIPKKWISQLGAQMPAYDRAAPPESAEQVVDKVANGLATRARVGGSRSWKSELREFLLREDIYGAQRLLLDRREAEVQSGRQQELHKIDSEVWSSVINDGEIFWGDSAGAYNDYLLRHPNSLLPKLARVIAAQAQFYAVKLLAEQGRDRKLTLLDVCCGTGQVPLELIKLRAPVRILGFDLDEMIQKARSNLRQYYRKADFNFFPMVQLETIERQSIDIVTLNMAVFQFSPLERCFLWSRIVPALRPGALLLFSTHSPDFTFPVGHSNFGVPGEVADRINQPDPFKSHLRNLWSNRGVKSDFDVASSITPRYAKDSIESIRFQLEPWGINLLSSADTMPLIEVDRPWEERIDFTSIPAISRKVFGKVWPKSVWDAARKPPQKYDSRPIFGTVLAAQVGPQGPRNIHLFFDPKVALPVTKRCIFAAAGVIWNTKKGIWMARRSEHARDYHGQWSLPSTSSPLAGSYSLLSKELNESAEKNLSREGFDWSPIAIRMAYRQTIDGEGVLLVMTLFSAELPDGQLHIKIPSGQHEAKYTEYKWMSIDTLKRERIDPDEGDCMKALKQCLRCGWAPGH